MKVRAGFLWCVILTGAVWASAAHAEEYASSWPKDLERTWAGPEFWANRLQDWRIANGRLECLCDSKTKPFRTVHLLTRRVNVADGAFSLRTRTGTVRGVPQDAPDSTTGFLIGAGNGLDFRAAALIHHSTGAGAGLIAGVDGIGRAVFRDMTQLNCPVIAAGEAPHFVPPDIELTLQARQEGGFCQLLLYARDRKTGERISMAEMDDVPSGQVTGNIALVSHPGVTGAGARYWFRDFTASGSKIEAFDEDEFGPILCAQYTLSRGILKLTAQFAPIGDSEAQESRLEINVNNKWITAATAQIVKPGYTATFRVTPWSYPKNVLYRVVYNLRGKGPTPDVRGFYGTIRKDPVEQPIVVMAAFTGNHNVRPGGVDQGTFDWSSSAIWFPHTDLVGKVTCHEPDLVFFSGDQVYEAASPTVPEPNELDYLYKWYLWCWAYRDLVKDRPCICLPDDHDVYQGNLWGTGGRKAKQQDDGGYVLPAEFVNMVQRTQTSHLPDPYDPAPAEQGIGVYYCAMTYGGLSFALLEDRKFKSSPAELVPEGQCRNGWFQAPGFNPAAQADVPGAALLGDRQVKFLEEWAADWSGGAQMKAVLSQTLFANVATLPGDAKDDSVVSQLEIPAPGEYPEYYAPVADADSNGWPQSGRNGALRAMRKGFAFHVCGDQHLGSTVHYGVEEWNDAGYALCVPSIANFFPRRWYPPRPGANHEEGAPRYTGEYLDGFGNRITVLAAANPEMGGREPAALYDRAPGYGIVRFKKARRIMTLECWPRWQNPTVPDAQQYPGWPITVTQDDNYGRKPAGYLPTLNITGAENPVVQVIDESNGEIQYTLRILGTSYRPKVFKAGTYTIVVSEPDAGRKQTLTGVKSLPAEDKTAIDVTL